MEEVQPSVWSHQWSGAGVKTWLIIAIIAAAATILGLAIACRLYYNQGKPSTMSIHIDNSNLNTSPTAPETTLVNMATNTAVYVEKGTKEKSVQKEEAKPALTAAEEEAQAIEIARTKKWLASL